MTVSIGAAAVREHADEAGLTEGISAIVRAFGKENVKDIEIQSPGRRSAIKEFTKEPVRIAVTAIHEDGIKEYISKLRVKK